MNFMLFSHRFAHIWDFKIVTLGEHTNRRLSEAACLVIVDTLADLLAEATALHVANQEG